MKKKPIDFWTATIGDEEVSFRLFTYKDGFRAIAKRIGVAESPYEDYPTGPRPPREKVRSDFTEHFLLKKGKVLRGSEADLWDAIDRSAEDEESGS